MWPWGHGGFAYLVQRGRDAARGRAPVDGAGLAFLLVAAVLPDLVDKPLAWGVGVLPSGRSLAHSLLVLAPALALAAVVEGHRTGGTRWTGLAAVGVLTHVAGDLADVALGLKPNWSFVAWPVLAVPADAPPSGLTLTPYQGLQVALAAAALVLWARSRRRAGEGVGGEGHPPG